MFRYLSVRQPFAHLIVAGVKDVENRDWPTSYRGTLLIHAAAGALAFRAWSDLFDMGADMGPDDELEDTEAGIVLPAPRVLARGAIVGAGDVEDCLFYYPCREPSAPAGGPRATSAGCCGTPRPSASPSPERAPAACGPSLTAWRPTSGPP